MPIGINGSGTIAGISAGGLPDGSITNDDLAGSIADAKLSGTTCKAWVNFNGTGTVAIRASFNVSSITDNGTGDYTVNFTTALADANYSVNVIRGTTNTNQYSALLHTLAAGSVRFVNNKPSTATNTNPTAVDDEIICVAIFR
jgi:hypothetical protein